MTHKKVEKSSLLRHRPKFVFCGSVLHLAIPLYIFLSFFEFFQETHLFCIQSTNGETSDGESEDDEVLVLEDLKAPPQVEILPLEEAEMMSLFLSPHAALHPTRQLTPFFFPPLRFTPTTMPYERVTVPQQRDGYNCGLFMLEFFDAALMLLGKCPIDSGQHIADSIAIEICLLQFNEAAARTKRSKICKVMDDIANIFSAQKQFAKSVKKR